MSHSYHGQSNYHQYNSFSQQNQQLNNNNNQAMTSSVSNLRNDYNNINTMNTAHIDHTAQSQYKWQWKCGAKWKDYQAQHSQVTSLFLYHRAHVTHFHTMSEIHSNLN